MSKFLDWQTQKRIPKNQGKIKNHRHRLDKLRRVSEWLQLTRNINDILDVMASLILSMNSSKLHECKQYTYFGAYQCAGAKLRLLYRII